MSLTVILGHEHFLKQKASAVNILHTDISVRFNSHVVSYITVYYMALSEPCTNLTKYRKMLNIVPYWKFPTQQVNNNTLQTIMNHLKEQTADDFEAI
jgi:hypothetical protein